MKDSSCRRTIIGSDYHGKINRTKDGQECMKWSVVDSRLPNHNFCRYLPWNITWKVSMYMSPWCVGKSNKKPTFCDVPFCGNYTLFNLFVINYLYKFQLLNFRKMKCDVNIMFIK